MSKTILHLGAGKLMINNIRILKDAGYRVFVADKSIDAPGFPFADSYKTIDIIDSNKLLEYAIEIKANAIMAVNDAGVLAASEVCEKIGLPGCSVEAVRRATDKGLMRESWSHYGLSQPKFIICTSREEIIIAIDKIGFPCVLKPCLNWGSRGVSVIHTKDDVNWAVNFAFNNNRNNRFIVEEYINGFEVTVEGLVKNNEVSILANSDKEHQYHPNFRVAMSLNYPAELQANLFEKLDSLIINAVKSLEINNAAFHAECMIRGEEVFLVEMAARPGGGHIFSFIVEAVSGINMPITLAKILSGEEVDIWPKYNRGACYKFFNAPPGIYRALHHLDEARKTKGVLDIDFDLEPGTSVGAISGDADRPGYIVTSGKDRAHAVQVAQGAFDKLKFISDSYDSRC
jgi:biotin carboxylase